MNDDGSLLLGGSLLCGLPGRGHLALGLLTNSHGRGVNGRVGSLLLPRWLLQCRGLRVEYLLLHQVTIRPVMVNHLRLQLLLHLHLLLLHIKNVVIVDGRG